jgi:acylphosphatase
MKTVRLRISGRVQGVWYRAWTRETAEGLGLNGWVRNRMDGSVEAVVQGEEDAVAQLIEKCWEGPTAARVENIIFEETDETIKPGFKQERTV